MNSNSNHNGKSRKFYSVLSIALSVLVFSLSMFYGIASSPYSDVNRKDGRPLSVSTVFSVTLQVPAYPSRNSSLEIMKDSIAHTLETQGTVLGLEVRFLGDGRPYITSKVTEVSGDVVLLSEVFEKIRYTDMHVHLSLVGQIHFEKLRDVLAEYGFIEKVTLFGIEKKDVADLEEFVPSIPYYLDIFLDMSEFDDEESLKILAREIARTNALGVNVLYRYVTTDFVDVFRENALLVSIYMLDSQNTIDEVIPLSVDNITTHSPDIATQIEYLITQS